MTTAAGGSYSRWAAGSGLVYGLAVFIGPITTRADWWLWALSATSFLAFAWLYVGVLRCYEGRQRGALVNVALMVVLGFGLMPINVASVTYVVYAAALAPLVMRPRDAVMLFVLLAATSTLVIAASELQSRLIVGSWVAFVIFATGASTLFLGERERQYALLRRAHEEVEQLATIAERERIARDLHDLLGHTLSVIVLKSELASKVATTDPARAVAEIRDVETISREALSEVRATVEGYRARGFAGELRRARQALSSAGVGFEEAIEPVRLVPRLETVLALVLREGVTNVARHSRASVCRVGLRAVGTDVVLTVQDDGIGGAIEEGSGLAGMRERIRAAGGSLEISGSSGVAINARFPTAPSAAA